MLDAMTGADVDFNGSLQKTPHSTTTSLVPTGYHKGSVSEGSSTQISKFLFVLAFSKQELPTHFSAELYNKLI